jgi:hypothetical protein
VLILIAMALKREYADIMRRSGFISKEIKDLSSAKTPDGKPQDLDKICNSETFRQACETRREWWKKALLSKRLGGWGFTYKEAENCIKNHYKATKGRKKLRSFWAFMKVSYQPPQKIKTKRAFTEAVILKSKIGRDMGQYGAKLRHARSPVLSGKCHLCQGNGSVQNIEGRQQTCPRCAGTGRSAHQRFL